MSNPRSLSMSYEIQKRNKRKKMANGGAVNESAKTEHRPMPDERDKDTQMVGRNSGNKPPKEDSWSSTITIRQAQKPSITKLSQPKIVGSDAFSVRNRDQRDENNDQIDSFYPESDKAQPRKRYDEEDAKGSGNRVPDMERQHKAKKAPYEQNSESQYAQDMADPSMKKKQSPLGRYAKGGKVGDSSSPTDTKTSTTGNKTKTGGSNPGGASTGGAGTVTITTRDLGSKGINVSNVGGKTDSKNHGGMDPGDEDDDGQTMLAIGGPVMEPKDHGQELEEREDEAHMMELLSSTEHGEQPAKWRDELDADEQNGNKLDMEEQHSNGRKPYYQGGKVYPNEMMDVPDEEAEMEHQDSIAAAIMAKKDRMKKILDSGSLDEDAAVKFYEGGQVEGSDESMVDIMSNGAEHPNAYYNRNENEVLKENYNSDMANSSQPLDSNEHSDDIDSDTHDMISKIRSQMNKNRQFKAR